MTFRKLAAVALIFVGASAAWTILGSSVLARTGQFDGRLEREVHLLWGGPHRQTAPDAWIERPGTDTQIEETKAADGRVTKRQVTKPVVRRVPRRAWTPRAPRPTWIWSTAARACSGMPPTPWRSRAPTPSATRTPWNG